MIEGKSYEHPTSWFTVIADIHKEDGTVLKNQTIWSKECDYKTMENIYKGLGIKKSSTGFVCADLVEELKEELLDLLKEKRCDCDTILLMRQGCKCGGI